MANAGTAQTIDEKVAELEEEQRHLDNQEGDGNSVDWGTENPETDLEEVIGGLEENETETTAVAAHEANTYELPEWVTPGEDKHQEFLDGLIDEEAGMGFVAEVAPTLGLDRELEASHWRVGDHAAKYGQSISFDYPTCSDPIDGLFSCPNTVKLMSFILAHKSSIEEQDTIYLQVDTRSLNRMEQMPGQQKPPPDFFKNYSPWLKARCSLIGPCGERTASFFVPIQPETGLASIHYTWAGPFALEAAVFLFPTKNWILIDTDCVPTSLFEVEELVKLHQAKRMEPSNMPTQRPPIKGDKTPAVLLVTEHQAEYNAGLIIIASAKENENKDLHLGTEHLEKSLKESRARFLTESQKPPDSEAAMMSGLLFTPLLGCRAKNPVDWLHAWALIGLFMNKVAFPPGANPDGSQAEWGRNGHTLLVNPKLLGRRPPFTTWARPIFEQGALPVLALLPMEFVIISLPGDKLYQARDVDMGCTPPPLVHSFGRSKNQVGDKLRQLARTQGLPLLMEALLGSQGNPPHRTAAAISSEVTSSAAELCLIDPMTQQLR